MRPHAFLIHALPRANVPLEELHKAFKSAMHENAAGERPSHALLIAAQSGRSVPRSPSGMKRAVGMILSGGMPPTGSRENIIRCSLALEIKNG